MALNLGKKQNIPSDGVIISESEAQEYITKILENWDATNIWPLKYGPGFLGAASAMTGIFINYHYRQRLHLGNYGQIITYLPIVVLPSLLSAVLHKLAIQPRVYLQKHNCPLCLQTHAGVLQVGLGVLYPAGLAPAASFMFAVRHFTYRLPPITKDPKEWFKVYKNMTRPISFALVISVGLHFLLATYITHKELMAFHGVQMKLASLEQMYDNERTS